MTSAGLWLGDGAAAALSAAGLVIAAAYVLRVRRERLAVPAAPDPSGASYLPAALLVALALLFAAGGWIVAAEFEQANTSEQLLLLFVAGSAIAALLLFTAARWGIGQKRSAATLARLARTSRVLSLANQALVRATDEGTLLDDVCRLLVGAGGYRMAWVGFAQHDSSRSIRPVAQFGDSTGYLDHIRISWDDGALGAGPTGTAVRTQSTQINQNFRTNPRMAPWREAALAAGFQSSAALPLVNDGQAVGALTLYSGEPTAFDADEVNLLNELAGDLAFGIVNLRLRAKHREAERQLAFLAHHDPLTHLPNRLLLVDRFERARTAALRDGSAIAVLFLDLDNFKQINDGLGHQVGDELLIQAVARLRKCVWDVDTICRQGGDEFIILLTQIADAKVVSGIAERILGAFAEPFEIAHHSVTTSFSIGIAIYPGDGADFETVLKNADTATYQAKESGRNTYRFFTERMNVDAAAYVQLQNNLRQALRQGEFSLHFQPQFALDSGRIVGTEALVRWQRPHGLMLPSDFIGTAEQSGLIVPLGTWILDEACRCAAEWRTNGALPPVVAVNLSALQFKRGNILEAVERALGNSGLPPQRLELELTESILLQDTEAIIETLCAFKSMGVRLAIDDFGTGYSSLAYLKRLPVDKLKIDQSFIRQLGDGGKEEAIVRAIIQLGHTLQLTVTAEGVESPQQLDFLTSHGCNEAQGFLLGRPLPTDALNRMLAAATPA
jgi:diguanylate cyclase (GGDEF)-like protein